MNAETRQLATELARFDGKRTATLARIAAAHSKEPRFDERLFACADASQPVNIRVAATWILLRRAQEHPSRLLGLEIALVDRLAGESAWEPLLHLLQMIDLLDLSEDLDAKTRGRLFQAVMHSAQADKTLVRTWSLSILGRLGKGMPAASMNTIAQVIRDAEQRGSASMKARIRRLRSSGELGWMNA